MSGERYLFRRSGVWQYRRRVPRDLRHLDPRAVIFRSTPKRDKAEAIVVANRINQETEEFWQTLASKGAGEAVDIRSLNSIPPDHHRALPIQTSIVIICHKL